MPFTPNFQQGKWSIAKSVEVVCNIMIRNWDFTLVDASFSAIARLVCITSLCTPKLKNEINRSYCSACRSGSTCFYQQWPALYILFACLQTDGNVAVASEEADAVEE